MPKPLVHEARIGEVRLQLRSECVSIPSGLGFTVTVRTYFCVEDDVTFRDIRTTWVRPLFEFLSFFWLRSARVLRVRARLRRHQKWLELFYPQLARSNREKADDASQGLPPFCTLGDLLARGYNFETLLQRHFDWRRLATCQPLPLSSTRRIPSLTTV